MDRRDLLLLAGGSLSLGLAGCFEQVERREDQEVSDGDASNSGDGADGNGGGDGDGTDGSSGDSDGQAGSEDGSADDGTAGEDAPDGSDSGDGSTGDDGDGADGTGDSTGDDGDNSNDGTDDSTDDGSDGSTDDGSDDTTDDGTDDGNSDDGSGDSDGSDDGTNDGDGDDGTDGGDDDGGDGTDDGGGDDTPTELPTSFTGTGMDGFFWTGDLHESDARDEDIQFLPPSEVDPPITIEGDVDTDSGTWESTTVFFPVLPVDGGVEVKFTAPDGLDGEIDFEAGVLTLEGDLRVDFVDIDAAFTTTIAAVTGQSEALRGDLVVGGESGTALLVDNEYVVDEATGNTTIDNKMNLPSTVSGDNWFELELDLDLTYD